MFICCDDVTFAGQTAEEGRRHVTNVRHGGECHINKRQKNNLSLPVQPSILVGLLIKSTSIKKIQQQMFASSSTTTDKRELASAPAGAREDSSSKKAKLDDTSSGTAAEPATSASPAANDEDEKVSTHRERRGSGTGLMRSLSSSMRNLSSDSLAYVDNFMRRNISKPSFSKKKTRRGRRRPTSRPSSATLATGTTSTADEEPEPMMDDDDQDDMVMDEEVIYVDTSDLNGDQQQGRPDLDKQPSGIFF